MSQVLVDVISKPSGDVSPDIGEVGSEILANIKRAVKILVARTVHHTSLPDLSPRKLKKESMSSQKKKSDIENVLLRYVLSNFSGHDYEYENIVAIGCSTGGPHALNEILSRFPMNFTAPILIVQHMPEKFTKKLAEFLDNRIDLRVVEAKTGMRIRRGVVYIAPGAYHMKVLFDRTISLIQAEQRTAEPRPSVDILMKSVAEVFKEQSIGVLLTGMGYDGVAGMNAIKDVNGSTIAQDEETSLIFGMPKMAIESGCIDSIVPLAMVADEIMAVVRKSSKK